jgi:hypothetical protein
MTAMKRAKRESEIEETRTRIPGWESGQSLVEFTRRKGYILKRLLYSDPPVGDDFDRLDAYQLEMILDEARGKLESLRLPTDLTPPSSLPDEKNLPEELRWFWQCKRLPDLSEGRLPERSGCA